jgi:hypothetical protein
MEAVAENKVNKFMKILKLSVFPSIKQLTMTVRVHFANVVKVRLFDAHLFGTLQMLVQQDMHVESALEEFEAPVAKCLQRAIIANPFDLV